MAKQEQEDWRNPSEEMRERLRERFRQSPTPRTTGRGRRSSSGFSSLGEELENGRVEQFRERIRKQAEHDQVLREAELTAMRAAFDGDCAECFDRGICEHCQRGRDFAEQLEAERIKDGIARMLETLPPRCQAFGFESFPYPRLPALRELREFLARWDEHRGLLLVGGYGTGKTGLMVSALREIARLWLGTNHRILFQTGPDLMDWLRAGYDSDRDNFEQRMQRAKQVRLLVIDDLGAEKPSEWVQERLFAIINHRYEWLLPTFITTNYGLRQLADRIGERIVDRLMETSDLIEFKPINLRRRPQ